MHQVLSVILILMNKINKVNHLNLVALNYNKTDEANLLRVMRQASLIEKRFIFIISSTKQQIIDCN